MMEWTVDSQTLQGELRLVGDLNIADVARFKEVMAQTLSEAEQVTLNLEQVASIDVAGLQILCACHRFGEAHQKRLLLQTGDNQVFAKVVEETGFTQWAIRSFGEEQIGLLSGRE